jgi:hypothetical protein
MMKLISIIALLTACGAEEDATTATSSATTTTTTTSTTAATISVTSTGDTYSDAACEGYGMAEVDIQLASNEGDAASVVFVPYNDTNSALITMPDSGDGYMVIEIADWMTWMRIFTDTDVEYSFVGGDDYGRDENMSCPTSGMTDQLMAFHEWDFYTVKFDASSPAEFWFQADKQQ